jgi:DNA replication ATP-dependent helicase Dna2
MLKRLADAHPDCVAQLTFQYRMHGEICQLSNDIVYKGTLKCANDFVAQRRLVLRGFPENLPSIVNQGANPWLNEAVDPLNVVVFLDTDKIKQIPCGDATDSISPLEKSSGGNAGGSIVNETEASLVCTVIAGLIACGLDVSSIGVICPFRAQIRLLEGYSSVLDWKCAGLELSTIDRYQGRDKPAIVISFVRSNVRGKVGRLMEDFRRLNVAVTRAKYKLIMIGSYSTLHRGSDVLKPVLQRLKSSGRVVELTTH